MNRFKGKKLLLLGSSVGTIDIIKYAQSEGAYVIVADYLDDEQSEGKKIANESVKISTCEIDKLEVLCRERNVDSIFAGVSEFNLLNACTVSERIGKQFYFDETLWDKFMDKHNFHLICKKYNVPTPKTYFAGNESNLEMNSMLLEFPVIIKPIDGCANQGISICENNNEALIASEKAREASKSSQIIVEEYVDGIEISCTYVIKDGMCKLVCMGDKYAYENEKKLKALANAYIYPSEHLEEYISSGVNENISAMFVKEGVNNCTVFLQGIYSKGQFFFFEAGLRMEGTASYNITEYMTGENFMKFMVDNALQVPTEYDINREDASFAGRKCIYFSLIVGKGKITNVVGLECISSFSNIVSYVQRHKIGQYIDNDGTLRQLMFRFIIVDDDIDKVIQTIKTLQENIKVYDENGNDMIIHEFDPLILKNK